MIFNLLISQHCAFSSRNLGRVRASLQLLTALSPGGEAEERGGACVRPQTGRWRRRTWYQRERHVLRSIFTRRAAQSRHPCMCGSESTVVIPEASEGRAALSGLCHYGTWLRAGGLSSGGEHSGPAATASSLLYPLPRTFPHSFILGDEDQPRPRPDFVRGCLLSGRRGFSTQETGSSVEESLLCNLGSIESLPQVECLPK